MRKGRMTAYKQKLTIEKLGPQGDGIAKLSNAQVVYVEKAAPSDVAECAITEDRSGNLHGTIERLIENSPDRITPPCVHYNECGGCALQHISNTLYKDWKSKSVYQLLARARLNPAHLHEPVFVPHHTRRRVTFAALLQNKELTFGFNRARSNIIEPIEDCLLLTPALAAVAKKIPAYIKPLLKENTVTDVFLQEVDGDIELVLTGALMRDRNDAAMIKLFADLANECGITRIGTRAKEFDDIETQISLKQMSKNFSGLNVAIPIGNFLQPSAEGEHALASIVASYLPSKKFIAMDLFAGCGTFSGVMVDAGGTVTAYELDKVAVSNLNKALGGKRKSKAEARQLFAEPVTAREMNGVDIVVLDPPRAGASEQCERLAASKVSKIIYVSCNPQSFARDSKWLVDGGYRFTNLHMVDQFTWSTHVEVVGVFER